MNHMLILDPDASLYRKIIAEQDLPNLDIQTAESIDQAEPWLSKVNIIFGTPALVAEIADKCNGLKWVQSTYAGVEQLCRKNQDSQYLLTGIKGLFGSFMREYVFAYILARERSLFETYSNQKQRRWSRISYRSLAGLTIGVIGLGSIGTDIARTARHFDMRVLGMRRTRSSSDMVDHCYTPDELADFLPQLDYLVLVLPDTEATRNFITLKELQMMKPDAVLINGGRGSSINQHDLTLALESKKIGGAVLDVFEQEPLPSDSPLWSMEQVIVTPHNAAYSFPDQVAQIFCDNYRRFTAGAQLTHIIDFTRGY